MVVRVSISQDHTQLTNRERHDSRAEVCFLAHDGPLYTVTSISSIVRGPSGIVITSTSFIVRGPNRIVGVASTSRIVRFTSSSSNVRGPNRPTRSGRSVLSREDLLNSKGVDRPDVERLVNDPINLEPKTLHPKP